MKYIYTFFFFLLALCGVAQAQTITFDATQDVYGTDKSVTGAMSIEKDGITIAITGGTLANGINYRIYKNQTITVTSTVGDIESIEFSCSVSGDTQYGPGCFEGQTGYSVDGTQGKWKGSSSSVSFKASTYQVRANKIEVTINNSDPNYVATPKITPATGTYYAAQKVSIEADEDATVYYTIDGTEPTTSSTVYTTPFTVEATTTVKAIAVKDGNISTVATSVITIETLAIQTIAEVLAAGAGAGSISATVVADASTGVLVQDATGYIFVYTGSAPEVKTGDMVTVLGPTSEYGGRLQFTDKATITKTGTTEVSYPEPIILDATAFDALVNNLELKYVEVQGTITSTGQYYNFKIDGTTHTGSLMAPTDVLNQLTVDAVVKITGYFVYVTGTSTKYGNIIVTNLELQDVTYTEYTTLADMKAATPEDETAAIYAQLNLTDMLVSYVNGQSAYLFDGTDGMLIFGTNSKNLKTGDKISGSIKGKLYRRYGNTQLAVTAYDMTVNSSGNTVESQVISPAAFNANGAAYENELITLKGLVPNAEALEDKLITFSYEDDEKEEIYTFTVRDNFGVVASSAFDKNKVYDVTGFVAVYTKDGVTTIHIYPRERRDLDNGVTYEFTGDGTLENPYSVKDVQNINTEQATENVWVKAYIVGYINGSRLNDQTATFSAQAPEGGEVLVSNLLVADAAEANTLAAIIPVALPGNSITRKDLNLKDHADKLGTQVWLKGNITIYMGATGLKEVYSYSLDGTNVVENNPDSLVITANSFSRKYGETNPILTYTATGGTLSGTPSLTCEATKTSPVGTYPIVIDKGSVTNSNVTLVNGTLTVTKAPLTITVQSVSKKQGEVNPQFEIIYSGFKNGETDSVLTQKPTITCNATSASPNGNYPITVSGATAQNYDITYVNGTLTVGPSPYAVLSDNNTVLTFYYDDQKEDRGGMSVGPFSYDSYPGWHNQRETLTTIVFDTSFANCSSLTSTAYWFNELSKLTAITGIENLKTDNVTEMFYMFNECFNLANLDVSNFKTDNVTDMSFMFRCCSGLTSLDVSNFKTDNVTHMNGMFDGCSSLTSLDVSGFKTDNVASMTFMFGDCSSLMSLDVSNFKTDNVTDMSGLGGMFFGCSGLTSLDVSNFKTDNVTDMSWMFYGCSSLTSLDVSNFKTAYVEDMRYMFFGCSSLTRLDVSNFKTDMVTHMNSMFEGCSELKTIYAGNGWSTKAVADGGGMFTGCTKLVGGAGTIYDANHTDATYAKIDGGTSNPGYFTGVNAIASFITNGMAFKVTNQAAEKTVTYVQGPSVEHLIIPSSVTYDGQTYAVTAIADSAFAGQSQLKSVKIPSSVKAAGKSLFAGSPHVAAIIWEAPIKMTQEMAGSVANNPNLLFYTSDTAYAPDGVTNIINSQTKQAERIVLSDGDSNDFYCPEEFSAGSISYTHTYQLFTVSGQCQGWESLVLPFDVTEIRHETKGTITPFGALQVGHEFDNGTKPFWLYEYTTGRRFTEADGIRANVPYILSMPNEAKFSDEYILAGNITFKGTNATVKATSGAKAVQSGNYSFTPNYQNGTSGSIYLLNVDKNFYSSPKGSVFVRNDHLERQARPFEAYFRLDGSTGVKSFISIFDELTDGIRSMEPAKRNANVEYYQLDGTKRSNLQRGFNIIRTKDKVQKLLVR